MPTIRIRMSNIDICQLRLAISPLTELALSFYALQSGQISRVHREWVGRAKAELPNLPLDILRTLIPVRGEICEFFYAGVRDATTSLDEQFEALRSLPQEEFRRDLAAVWGSKHLAPLSAQLSAPGMGRETAVTALEAYWNKCIAPEWDFMRSALEEDVSYRSKALVNQGLCGLMNDVHERLSFQDDQLVISEALHEEDIALNGGGLALVPSIFADRSLVWQANLDGPSFVSYPARGIPSLWDERKASQEENESLAALLGRGRATVLQAVLTPRSTTDLARALHQSPGTVSAHLSILKASGLVSSWRLGRRVLYARTPLGSSIVAANVLDGSERTSRANWSALERSDPFGSDRKAVGEGG